MNYNINGLTVNLSIQILNELRNYYHLEMRYETGGILLGCFNQDFIEITEVYKINPSFLSKIYYRSNVKKAQKLVNRRWQESGGVVNYLGEWHTHPNMSSTPSGVDKDTLNNISIQVKNKIPGVVMVILGKDTETTIVIGREGKIDAFICN